MHRLMSLVQALIISLVQAMGVRQEQEPGMRLAQAPYPDKARGAGTGMVRCTGLF